MKVRLVRPDKTVVRAIYDVTTADNSHHLLHIGSRRNVRPTPMYISGIVIAERSAINGRCNNVRFCGKIMPP